MTENMVAGQLHYLTTLGAGPGRWYHFRATRFSSSLTARLPPSLVADGRPEVLPPPLCAMEGITYP